MEPVSLRFASAARALGETARALGLDLPTYRTPPRTATLARSLRRHPQGAVVSVQLRDRPWLAVLADMVEGLVAANRLSGAEADACRTALWAQVEQRGLAATSGESRRSVPTAGPVAAGPSPVADEPTGAGPPDGGRAAA